MSMDNSLDLQFPDLVKEWDYENNKLSPKDYSSDSTTTVKWVCKKGHPIGIPQSRG